MNSEMFLDDMARAQIKSPTAIVYKDRLSVSSVHPLLVPDRNHPPRRSLPHSTSTQFFLVQHVLLRVYCSPRVSPLRPPHSHHTCILLVCFRARDTSPLFPPSCRYSWALVGFLLSLVVPYPSNRFR